MPYTPPLGTAADASFQGANVYTPPTSTSADANWLQTVSVPLLTNDQAFYAASVTPSYDVAAPLLTNTNTLYIPAASQPTYVNFTFQGENAYTPSPNGSIVFQFGTGSTNQVVDLPLLTNSSTIYVPTVEVGTVTMAAPLLTNTNTIYSPEISMALSAPLLTNTNVLYAPAIPVVSIRVMDATNSYAARSYRAYNRSTGVIIQQGTSALATGMVQVVGDPAVEMDIHIIGQGTEPDVFIRKVMPT